MKFYRRKSVFTAEEMTGNAIVRIEMIGRERNGFRCFFKLMTTEKTVRMVMKFIRKQYHKRVHQYHKYRQIFCDIFISQHYAKLMNFKIILIIENSAN